MGMRKCCVCGKEYKYCAGCQATSKEPAWRSSFDTENCKKIYKACADFAAGNMTKEEAAAILDTCDMADLDNFTVSTKKLINTITATPVVEKTTVVEVPKVEEKPKKKFKPYRNEVINNGERK